MPAWYAKYRLPDGRQVQKKIGPAWVGRGRPPAGYVTKRLAEEWLAEVLADARRGMLPGLVRTGATLLFSLTSSGSSCFQRPGGASLCGMAIRYVNADFAPGKHVGDGRGLHEWTPEVSEAMTENAMLLAMGARRASPSGLAARPL